MLGQEPRDISALYFLNYCKSFGEGSRSGLLQLRTDEKHGGQYLRVRQGNQLFSHGLESELPPDTVRLKQPVVALHQMEPQKVEVTTDSGTVSARKVIVAISTSAYKNITFQPALPQGKRIMSDSFHFGYYTKVMFAFKSPFWSERGFCGLAQSFLGPASIMRDVSVPAENEWVIACFVAGDRGVAWSKLPPEEKEGQLLAQIARLFATQEVVEDQFIDCVTFDWSTDKYSGWGCPCPSLGPGVLDTYGDALREPCGNIHFVGVETAGNFKGFMEGAVRSGERGAAEVVDGLARRAASL